MVVSAGDVDRLFLQATLSRGVMSVELAKNLWARSVQIVNDSNSALKIQHNGSKDAWNEFLTRINRSIDKLDLEVKVLHDEESGREMCALVNTKGDEIAQLATDYTPAEITFFKGVVEQIMLAPHEAYSVSSLAALREINELKLSMTKSQGEILLASFVAKGWLLKSKLGRYSLSTRSLLELQPYLKSTYPDEILECTVCMEILTRGLACYTPNCKVRMHHHCFARYRRSSECPSCSTKWPQQAKDKQLVPVGEGAAREGDGRRRRAQTQDSSDAEEEEPEPTQEETPKQNGKRRQSNKNVKFDASMETDEDEEDESVPSQTQARAEGSQRSRRSTRR
ncbi:hypothetical protein CPC08DRAFT_680722 [Agrocybe pediades]|nr:hypothetical protein CPC08DRAFT_680722 [Agrocybe pediades]